MKVSKLWLDKFFDSPLPKSNVLAEALTFHAFEIENIEHVGSDDVLDVKVTPNRGHDCLSHRGIAKELSAILKIPISKDPFAETPVLAPITNEISVSMSDPSLCKRYIAAVIKGVKVGPSPVWLKERLEALGQRSINNVVDATNFVMFNLGQPLHAFDSSKLPGKDIRVRLARDGEEMTALDQKKYKLDRSMLLITSGDAPIGIAGVKGGMPAAITEDTKDIVIESANFDGASVRKTAQALYLRTDASQRFEQVMSPELSAYGIHSAVELIQKLAGGDMIGFVDVYPSIQTHEPISVTLDKINNLLGTQLTSTNIKEVFERLGIAYEENGEDFVVTPPFERLDLVISEDLVEEVARVIGYENVSASTLPPTTVQTPVNKRFYSADKIREELVSKGYSEVYTSVFAEHGEREVLNKVDSVRPFLRSSLVYGLTEALKKNVPNKDLLGLKEIKLFEIGTVWKNKEEMVMVGIVSETEKVTEKLLESIGSQKYEKLTLSSAGRYKPFSKFPYIVRDIAMWVEGVSRVFDAEQSEALEIIKKEAGELAIRVDLFDTFEKEGRISLAYRIVFQSFARTLTEVEINKIMENVAVGLMAKGFKIR